jgi:hypothetical protein
MADQARSGRLAELTIALSLSTDLGTGQPMEHGLRTCWLSVAVSKALGLEASTQSCVYYAALLRFVGCTSNASETAVLAGGNDVALNAAVAPMVDGPARRGRTPDMPARTARAVGCWRRTDRRPGPAGCIAPRRDPPR